MGRYNRALSSLLINATALKNQASNIIDNRELILSALEFYDKAQVYLGEDPDLMTAIADCQFRLGQQEYWRFEKAIEIMKDAIALRPFEGRLHVILSEYYELGTNEYEKAAKEARMAVELCPYDTRALGVAATLYRFPGNHITLDESIVWLERLVKLEPNEPIHHAFLAEQYSVAGRPEEAKREATNSLLCPQPLQGGWIDVVRHVLEFQ